MLQIGRMSLPFVGGSTPSLEAQVEAILSGKTYAWYDPADSATVFQERTSPTTPSGDGDVVGTILDKSGGAYHLAAPSDAARMIRRKSGSLWYLDFDGTVDVLFGVSDFALSQAHDIYAGVTIGTASNGATEAIFSCATSASASTDTEMAVYNNGGDYTFRSRYPSVDTFNTGEIITTSEATKVLTQSRVSNSQVDQYVNNVLEYTNNTSSSNFTTPRRIRTGRHTNSSQYFPGNIFGLIVVSDNLTSDERATLNQFLAERSGVTL